MYNLQFLELVVGSTTIKDRPCVRYKPYMIIFLEKFSSHKLTKSEIMIFKFDDTNRYKNKIFKSNKQNNIQLI